MVDSGGIVASESFSKTIYRASLNSFKFLLKFLITFGEKDPKATINFQPGFMTNVMILTSTLSIFHCFSKTYHQLGLSYGIYISRLIRYAQYCSYYDDFRYAA